MNRISLGLLALAIMSGITSCNNELNPIEDGNHRLPGGVKEETVLKTVRLSFGGDFISETEEPLLRADDAQTYVGINVFRTEKGNNEAKEEKYAYGLFGSKEGISIDVLTGYTYRFESSILIDDVDKLYITNGLVPFPFKLNYQQNLTGSPIGFDKEDMGGFVYTVLDKSGQVSDDIKRNYLSELYSGIATVDVGEDLTKVPGVDSYYPRVKRYYGECDAFDPGLTTGVEVNMDYKCFGLKFELVNLPSGWITVKDITKSSLILKDYPERGLVFPDGLMLFKPSDESGESAKGESVEWEGVFSMNDMKVESEKHTMQFTWHKSEGIFETFNAEITVSPGKKKVLRLNVNGDPNYQTKGNITLIMGDEKLTEDVEVINSNN